MARKQQDSPARFTNPQEADKALAAGVRVKFDDLSLEQQQLIKKDRPLNFRTTAIKLQDSPTNINSIIEANKELARFAVKQRGGGILEEDFAKQQELERRARNPEGELFRQVDERAKAQRLADIENFLLARQGGKGVPSNKVTTTGRGLGAATTGVRESTPKQFERPVTAQPISIPDEQLKGLSDIDRSLAFSTAGKKVETERETKLKQAKLIETVRQSRAKKQQEQALKKQFTLEEINNLISSDQPINEDTNSQIDTLIEEGKFLPTEEQEIRDRVNKASGKGQSLFQGIQRAGNVGINFLTNLINQQNQTKPTPTTVNTPETGEDTSIGGYEQFASEQEARANGKQNGDIVIINGEVGILE